MATILADAAVTHRLRIDLKCLKCDVKLCSIQSDWLQWPSFSFYCFHLILISILSNSSFHSVEHTTNLFKAFLCFLSFRQTHHYFTSILSYQQHFIKYWSLLIFLLWEFFLRGENLYLIIPVLRVWLSECRTAGMSTDWIDNHVTLPSDGYSCVARISSVATYCRFRWLAFRPVGIGINASSLSPPSDMRYAICMQHRSSDIWLNQLPIMSRDKGEVRTVTYITLRSHIGFNQKRFHTWRCSCEWRRSCWSSSVQFYAYTCSL